MIVVDTGFWLALADRRDTNHEAAKRALQKVDEPLITTWCVVTETSYLLLSRKGVPAQVAFLSSLCDGAFEVFDLERKHSQRMVQLMQKYADLPMDLADASLVVLAEHLGDGRILSVDRRDFNIYRWQDIHPFTNLFVN